MEFFFKFRLHVFASLLLLYCMSIYNKKNTTVTADVRDSYREPLPLVTAGVGDHYYSGCLAQLQRTVTAVYR